MLRLVASVLAAALATSDVSGVLASTTPHKKPIGAVACESIVCSNIGGDILKAGGNAADAMIATVLCVGTIDGHHSGIGGGGFALVRDTKGEYAMIDFRETAPALSNETMYSANPNPYAALLGGLSVGVPGELRGLEAIHQRYGKLPWKSLFQPAIKVARDGFVIQAQLAGGLQALSSEILASPALSAVYAPNGTLLVQGQTAYRPTYAKTLETIAEEGPDAFYTGSIAKASVAAAKAAGGILSLSDLKGYKALVRTPAAITYKGHKVISTVAPSSGTVLLSALNIMDGYTLTSVNDPTAAGGKRDSNNTAQILIESMKFAYGQRTELGDPAFVKNVSKIELEFITPKVGAEIRKELPLNHTGASSLYDPDNYIVLTDHGTSQIAVADSEGMVITLTTTVNYYFGSGIMVPETGIILNDEMGDFSSPGGASSSGYISSPANYIVPGKRPLSSISPTIVEDSEGNFLFAVGAAGGTNIITANLQVLHHYLDHGMTAQQSINSPRIHDQVLPVGTTFEYSSAYQNVTGYNNNTVAYLASLGHNVSWVAPGVSISSAIGHNAKAGTFDPAADPRIPGSGAVVV